MENDLKGERVSDLLRTSERGMGGWGHHSRSEWGSVPPIYMKRKAMKSPLPVAKILEGLLQRRGLAKKMVQYTSFEAWNEIVGPTIAKQTVPQKIRGDILFVAVKNNAWAQELSFMKAHILKKLNEHLPNALLQDIKFTVGKS